MWYDESLLLGISILNRKGCLHYNSSGIPNPPEDDEDDHENQNSKVVHLSSKGIESPVEITEGDCITFKTSGGRKPKSIPPVLKNLRS